MAPFFALAIGLACIAAEASKNPFLDSSGKEHPFYINPVNYKQYDSSISTASGQTRDNLRQMQAVPSAYWIDVKAKLQGTGTQSAEGILKDASEKSPPELVVLIWYDLPNRDCFAKASNGEICCKKKADGRCDYGTDGDCADGLEEYKTGYVDPFVAILKKYQNKLPIAVVVEPDSLPNLATNLFHPRCGCRDTQTAYKEGIKYSLHQLAAEAPGVAVYLDASHGGWLGWENSMEKFMKLLKTLEIPRSIRGFATNVANYQPLGVQCPWCPDQGFRNSYCLAGRHKTDPCCEDPCSLLGQYNFGNNELNYAAGLVAAADAMLGMDAHVVIDTGRNGVADHRQKCSHWCNPRNSGAGVKSTTSVANSSLVDAYFWLKTPGESDGCTEILPDGSRCPRFDYECKSEDSLGGRSSEPRAPEAGRWFDAQVKQLAANARFGQQSHSSSGRCSNEGGSSGYQPGGNQWHYGGGGNESPRRRRNHPAPSPAPLPEGESSGSPRRRRDHQGGSSGASGGGACSPAFGQCGGHHWKGPQCCEGDCRCRREGKWYHQCEPPKGTHLCTRRLLLNVTGATELGELRGQPMRATPGPGARLALAGALLAGLSLVALAAAARRRGGARGPGAGEGNRPPAPAPPAAPPAEKRALLDAELAAA